MAQLPADTHTALMLSRALAAVAVVLVGSLVSGCGGGGGSVLHSGHALVLVDADVHGPTVGVGFGGSLAMAGSCLGFKGTTVVWPHGTKIASAHPLTIDVPGLGRVSVGDEVVGGAGHLNVDRLPKGIDAIPTGCPTARVLVFYPDH